MIIRIVMAMVLSAAIVAQPFNAFVDSTSVSDGDSVTLTLEYEGKVSEQPDVSALAKDFQIISQSRGSESSYINGASSQKNKWIYELRPRTSASTVTIPSFKLGSYVTQPITLHITTHKEPLKERGIALIASTNTGSVYVNGEVIVTLELKTTLALQNGSLGKPEVKDAIVEPLIENDDKETIENGIRTFIFRRVYAVYPAKPGDMVIPSVNFEGVVNSNRGFFSQGRRMSTRSQPIPIKVMPIPSSYPKDQPFLPAKNLVVIESFDSDNPQFKINEATTRRFEIKALGTLSSFLPTVAAPQEKGLKVYSEAGLKANKNTEDGMEASLQFSHVYMPTSGGTFAIPEQKIYWWDTEKDQLRTTAIRPLNFTVSGPEEKRVVEAPSEQPVREQEKTIVSSSENQVNYWAVATGLLAILWCGTVGWWWYRSRRKQDERMPVKESKSAHIKAFDDALKQQDLRLAYGVLKNLMAQNLIVREQAQIWMVELESVLYGQASGEKSVLIATTIRQQLSKIEKTSKKEDAFGPLYPS